MSKTSAVSFQDLTDQHCKWPLWGHEEPSEGGLYCGKKRTHGSYCTAHGAIVYVAPEPRQKQRSRSAATCMIEKAR